MGEVDGGPAGGTPVESLSKGIKYAGMFEDTVMAKKRRKDRDKEEEEEYEFRPPEFEEEEFLKKEMADTWAIIVTVLYAIALAVVAWAMTLASRDLAGPAFLVAVAGAIALKWLYPLFKVNTKGFQKRNWAGNIGTFFFTFLAIWILLLNQPFADFAKPTVTDVTVWVTRPDGNTTAIDYKLNTTLATPVFQWMPRYGESLGGIIHAKENYTVNITARIADNDGLKSMTISVNALASVTMTSEGQHRWGYKITGNTLNPSTGLSFQITVLDKANNEGRFVPETAAIPVAP